MRVLVTGASGFIGDHLSEKLVEKGYRVSAFVRKSSDVLLLNELEVELRYGDLVKPETLCEASKMWIVFFIWLLTILFTARKNFMRN